MLCHCQLPRPIHRGATGAVGGGRREIARGPRVNDSTAVRTDAGQTTSRMVPQLPENLLATCVVAGCKDWRKVYVVKVRGYAYASF